MFIFECPSYKDRGFSSRTRNQYRFWRMSSYYSSLIIGCFPPKLIFCWVFQMELLLLCYIWRLCIIHYPLWQVRKSRIDKLFRKCSEWLFLDESRQWGNSFCEKEERNSSEKRIPCNWIWILFSFRLSL